MRGSSCRCQRGFHPWPRMCSKHHRAVTCPLFPSCLSRQQRGPPFGPLWARGWPQHSHLHLHRRALLPPLLLLLLPLACAVACGVQQHLCLRSECSGHATWLQPPHPLVPLPSLAGTSAGVGFAIPVATVARVVEQLLVYGKVRRATLGVQPAPDPVARALKVAEGVLIQTVEPGSAASAAGLLPTRRGLGGVVAGDVIVAGGWRRAGGLAAWRGVHVGGCCTALGRLWAAGGMLPCAPTQPAPLTLKTLIAPLLQ